MKKVSILVVVTVLAIGDALGLPIDFNNLTFGARVGVNFSNQIHKSTEMDFKRKPGIQIGIVGDYSLKRSFIVQSGILFSQQGYTAEIPFFAKEVVTLNYIQIPVNLQYKRSVDVGEVHWMVHAGPYLGLGINAKKKMNGNSEDFKFGSGKDIYLKRFDFGIGLGGGIQLNSILLGAVYNVGLAKLNNTNNIGSIKNNVLTISLTYFFSD